VLTIKILVNAKKLTINYKLHNYESIKKEVLDSRKETISERFHVDS